MQLTRYLGKEVIGNTLAIGLVLLVITLVGRLIKFLQQVMDGHLPAEFLLQMLVYRLPQFLELIVPFSLFLALLLTLRRLYSDSEMAVIQASGVSDLAILRMLMVPVTGITIVVAGMTLYLTPYTMNKAYRLLTNPENYLDYSIQVAGKIQTTHNGRHAMYIDHLDKTTGRLENIFVVELSVDKSDALVFSAMVADEARLTVSPETGVRYLRFETGDKYDGRFGSAALRHYEFERYGQPIGDSRQNIPRIKADAIPSAQLMRSDNPKDLSNFQWRVTLPLMLPVATLLALAFSRNYSRRSSAIKLFSAILLFILYFVALTLVRSAVAKGRLPYEAGFVVAHSVFLGIGLFVLFGKTWRKTWRYWRTTRRQAHAPEAGT